jgi:hypothetical protein
VAIVGGPLVQKLRQQRVGLVNNLPAGTKLTIMEREREGMVPPSNGPLGPPSYTGEAAHEKTHKDNFFVTVHIR